MSDSEPKPTLRHRGLIPVAVLVVAAVGVALLTPRLYAVLFEHYTGLHNGPLTYDSSRPVSERDFETLAERLTHETRQQRAQALTAGETNEFSREVKTNMLLQTRSFADSSRFPHIGYFRNAGIRQYEGPGTCLKCHATMTVHGQGDASRQVHTLEDVVESIHFKFQQTASGFTTYGYDGREVNAKGTRPIPMGKIDRACGIPGSFSWTGWATLVNTKPDAAKGQTVIRSEGCGQCHIGGGYQPATEKMMPVGDVSAETKQGIDCLICHSQAYDINQRTVLKDATGMRWNQARSLLAAMAVSKPTNNNCLFCHQHNMGGDAFAENVSAKNLGHVNQRIPHEGAKRGNPFSPSTDVHAAAGLLCTDCHVPVGHKIPRGTKGTDLVANDLPGQEVACETCHTAAPHTRSADRVMLNGHVDRIACETCHIKHLQDYSVVLRDWTHPEWEAGAGLYSYTDVYQSGEPKRGFTVLWFNGSGTFLANALGNKPLGGPAYNPLMDQLVKIDDPVAVAAIRAQAQKMKKIHPDLDVERYVREVTSPLSVLSPQMLEKRAKWIEDKVRPLMNRGKSKLYPFKLFNARMYEDMSNQGPFGGMILPFDYATYYETGDSLKAMTKAIETPIVRRMYERPFKEYMMDEFMQYFGIDKWSDEYPIQDGKLRNVEAQWMRQMGTLMFNHGIQREGRTCRECHSKSGIIDFARLGYPPARVRDLENPPEVAKRPQ
ncbi:MAG: nitrite reductase [Alphaproteobacteria bacterium]|nr:nitrite reductase [Alphaproteobacteria bacterium]